MTDSIQTRRKKTSFILASFTILYSVIATCLYSKYQVDLMKYTTPFLWGTVGIILSLATLQKLFHRYLTVDEICFSFGRESESASVEIQLPSVEPIKTETPSQQTSTKQDYTNGYEARIAEVEREKQNQRTDMMHEIHEYTTLVMTEFLSKEDLSTLHENIDCAAHGQWDLYKPIRSKIDHPLASIDLRHFVWNIGIRLNIPLDKCAEFIKSIFPHELENATLFYLSKNLRTIGTCRIPLDIPLKGEYHFNCLQKAAS